MKTTQLFIPSTLLCILLVFSCMKDKKTVNNHTTQTDYAAASAQQLIPPPTTSAYYTACNNMFNNGIGTLLGNDYNKVITLSALEQLMALNQNDHVRISFTENSDDAVDLTFNLEDADRHATSDYYNLSDDNMAVNTNADIEISDYLYTWLPQFNNITGLEENTHSIIVTRHEMQDFLDAGHEAANATGDVFKYVKFELAQIDEGAFPTDNSFAPFADRAAGNNQYLILMRIGLNQNQTKLNMGYYDHSDLCPPPNACPSHEE